MQVFLYTDVLSEAGGKLLDLIEQMVSQDCIEIIQVLPSLLSRLRKPAEKKTIVIAMLKNKKELNQLLSIRNVLTQGLLLILVLPDHHADTVAIAHKLYPRLLTYADGDMRHVAAFLKNLIGNHS